MMPGFWLGFGSGAGAMIAVISIGVWVLAKTVFKDDQ
jgi:hypothetical protein